MVRQRFVYWQDGDAWLGYLEVKQHTENEEELARHILKKLAD